MASTDPYGWVLVEESSFGERVCGGIFDDLAAVVGDRDTAQAAADDSGAPVLFRVYELREVSGP